MLTGTSIPLLSDSRPFHFSRTAGTFVQVCLLYLLAHSASEAAVKLPAIFSDYMVLQQNTNARIWGTANPGERVKISTSWGGENNVVANSEGNWATALTTPVGSHDPQTIRFEASNVIKLNQVMIGEVWLCSGQSNMGWRINQSNNAETEIANANHPSIRFIAVPTKHAWGPQFDIEATWQICSPDSAVELSAVAYFFGRELIGELDVPVGLVVSAFGASSAEAWLEPGLAAEYGFQHLVNWYETHKTTMRDYRTEWLEKLSVWRAQQPANEKPDFSTRPKRPLPGDQHLPFGLYNAMLHPLIPYSIKGALWYQGESNVPRAHQYRTLFPAMIRSWRTLWSQGNFPFYYVQIAPFHYKDPEGTAAAELRDAQLKALQFEPNLGMVVISDIGNVENIHPRNKQDVGRRLARLALHQDYGKSKASPSSPFYESHQLRKDRIRISFDHAKRLRVDGDEIIGFTIAGQDQQFFAAKAKIVRGNQIDVWSPQVASPRAVRYGWANASEMNLFNEIDLPVSTFKTDPWRDTTEGVLYLNFP